MNFLELCQELRSEAGIAGSGPVSTVAQTGELLKVVNYVKKAYRDIQDRRQDWDFLRDSFSFTTTVDKGEYSKSEANVSDLRNWHLSLKNPFRCSLTSAGYADETFLVNKSWDVFQRVYLLGANRDAKGKPLYYAIKPDKSIIFWPVPDNVYTISGEYFKVAQTFSGDLSVPVFNDHHMAIVYEALKRYAAYESEAALYTEAVRERNRLVTKLEADYAPRPYTGGPIA